MLQNITECRCLIHEILRNTEAETTEYVTKLFINRFRHLHSIPRITLTISLI